MADFRLDGAVRPVGYRLHFDLDLDAWRVSGHAWIELSIAEPRPQLTLHALGLRIDQATAVSSTGATPRTTAIAYSAESETATLSFDRDLAAGAWTLELTWSGDIREALRGIYRSSWHEKRMASTQFEPADARRAFPCFDEPAFKATFAIELEHPAGLAVISNGPIIEQSQQGPGRTLTRFAQTPLLPTYLVAFSAGPYEATAEVRSDGGVPIRVWLPAGLTGQADCALDAHQRALSALEGYTQIPYAFGKLDAIGVPDFESNAMENAGAITYRLRVLAVDPVTATSAALKQTFRVSAHELTHMWWGDLVTMAWWNDLWLNEAFAAFIGDKLTAELNPQWRYWRDFVAGGSVAFDLDALRTTHPVAPEQVRNIRQAIQRFDAITYQKGARVLRMIERYLGAEVFRAGVRRYLEGHPFANATAEDFWQSLTDVSGRDVGAVAGPWIHEPGHPLLGCATSTTSDGLRVTMTQEPFASDPDRAAVARQWPIPVVITVGTDRGREERAVLVAPGKPLSIDLPAARWYHPNATGAGFYRYLLDPAGLQLLMQSIEDLPVEERLALLANLTALVRARRTSVTELFALIDALRPDRDRAVIGMLADVLHWLGENAVAPENAPAFRARVRDQFTPLLKELGWRAAADESSETHELRAIVIQALAQDGHDRAVVAQAIALAQAEPTTDESIDGDLANAIATAAAVAADPPLWDAFRSRMRAAAGRDAQEELRYRNALSDVQAPDLAARSARACFDGTFKTQDLPFVFERLLGTAAARAAAWPIIRDAWPTSVAPLDAGMRRRLVAMLTRVTQPELAAQVLALLQHPGMDDVAEAAGQAIEQLRVHLRVLPELTSELEQILRAASPSA